MQNQPTPFPSIIGRYQVERELGHGAMGTVYLAYDPYVKRPVAIKLLTQKRALEEEALRRFQREAEIVANLGHPCIVMVYDYGQYEKQPYIIMQYMAGGALVEKLTPRPLSLMELSPIIDRVAQALDTAHRHGIVHRDLKPGNILFDQVGKAYLADFGIAKIRDDLAQSDTGNVVLGTPEYMSPEQVRGQQGLDGRSDVYALGIACFQALTKQLPFRGSTPIATAIAHIMEPIPSLHKHRPDLPLEIDKFIRKALAKQPAERYQTAGELAQNLRFIAEGRGYHLKLVDL